MKLRSLRVERQPRLMIIPMIDIIFFLLVFFMMSTLYMVEQNVLPVALPQASTAQTEIAKQVSITVTAQGQVFMDKEQIPLELLGQRIQAELSRSQEPVFLLRADRQAEYGRVIKVLDELKKYGVRRISVATEMQ